MAFLDKAGLEHLWAQIINQLNTKENLDNKTTIISETSTNAQYPGAKAVYDFVTANIPDTSTFATKAQLSDGSVTKIGNALKVGTVTYNGSAVVNAGRRSWYGTCATSAATSAKVVNDCSDFVLETGAKISVRFTYENSAGSPTLNVNGTGAKSIRNLSLVSLSGRRFRLRRNVLAIATALRWDDNVLRNVKGSEPYSERIAEFNAIFLCAYGRYRR